MSEHEYLLILIMSAGAFFIPSLSKKMMLPSSVGEIVFGVVVASLLHIENDPHSIVSYFSGFGFLLLMYMAGLELEFDRLREFSKRDLILFIFMYVLVAIACVVAVNMLDLSIAFTLLFFTTGLGLLFPVLKDAGILKTDIGQTILIIGMIGEVLTLAGLTVFTLASEYGLTLSSLLHFSLVVGFIIGIYLMIKLLKVILWWFPHRQSGLVMVGNPTETGIRGNFLILFASVVFAEAMGIEHVVGAFIGGMIVALIIADRHAVLEKIGGVGYGFFIPIFFISVGMQVTITDILQVKVLLFSLGITGVLLVVKLFGSVILYFTSLNKRAVFLVASGLSFPLTMLVAVAAIFLELGLITKQESSAVLLASIISSIVYPWMFKFSTALLLPELTTEDKNI